MKKHQVKANEPDADQNLFTQATVILIFVLTELKAFTL